MLTNSFNLCSNRIWSGNFSGARHVPIVRRVRTLPRSSEHGVPFVCDRRSNVPIRVVVGKPNTFPSALSARYRSNCVRVSGARRVITAVLVKHAVHGTRDRKYVARAEINEETAGRPAIGCLAGGTWKKQ